MDLLQLEEISVSQRGVSEGVLLATLRYGDDWREHPDMNVDISRVGKAPAVSDVDEGDRPARDSNLEISKDSSPTSDRPEALSLRTATFADRHETLPHPRSSRGLHAQATFAETGRRELRDRSKKFLKCINPVLQNKDVEAVHQMRVASRRLRATLDAYESACAQKPFKSVYREVKQAADLLGTARDTDVMLQNLEQRGVPDTEMPGLQWLISRLQMYREQQQRKIVAFFGNFRSKRFERLVASCIPEGASHHGKN
jgi:hypothetical protein